MSLNKETKPNISRIILASKVTRCGQERVKNKLFVPLMSHRYVWIPASKLIRKRCVVIRS